MHKMFKEFGGGLLATGLLMAGAAGWMPGMSQVTELIPQTIIFKFSGGVAATGILLLLIGKTLEGRKVRVAAPQDEGINVAIRGASTTEEMSVAPERPDLNRKATPMRKTQRRVCLKPVWPQRKTQHWVGGLPSLPADTPWPEINNKPATFIAQISLSEMPDTLWQGIGPRTGWLVFFGDSETDSDAKILHVDGNIAPRKQSVGVTYYWDNSSSLEGLKHMIGTAAEVPPKWYVEIADQATLGAVEDMTNDDGWPEESKYWSKEGGDWIWNKKRPLSWSETVRMIHMKPYWNGTTWDTAFGILAALRAALEKNESQFEYAIKDVSGERQKAEKSLSELTLAASGSGEEAQNGQQEIKEARKALERIRARDQKAKAGRQIVILRLEQIEDMVAQLRITSQQVAYTPTIGADLHAYVDSITAEFKSNEKFLGFERAFGALMEHYARTVYASDPSSLPPELHALYAPLWEQECEDTAIFLGTNIDMATGTSWRARLLDMPSNPLTGIMIGDLSRYYADMPAEDLNAGDFTTAYGSNTHGQY